MYAVIETGSKQYKVQKDDVINVELLGKKVGAKVKFGKVLLVSDKGKVKIGTPVVKEAKVAGEVLREGKNKKVIAFFFRKRKDSKRKKGHRQKYLAVKITDISVA